ncbi:HET-domain-containing protein [Coniochaeta ligniaria NRRL 30616]|uniref:HET-domain-containing protein n=1 Tax=Coniochaeta ligniaria NRRL 30616 TaxID=1408157 RepID=A0A1J7JJX6_9PEZI|nr:HET-domain-containing protein [Coniochaeta ligniaria NRRL 30616]
MWLIMWPTTARGVKEVQPHAFFTTGTFHHELEMTQEHTEGQSTPLSTPEVPPSPAGNTSTPSHRSSPPPLRYRAEEVERKTEAVIRYEWEQQYNDEGEVCFVDRETGLRIVRDPLFGVTGAGELPEGWELRWTDQYEARFVDLNAGTTTKFDPRPSRPLPDGWEMRVNESRRLYFVDHTTQTTSFKDPRGDPGWQFAERLPAGWEMRHNPGRRIYFVNHNSRETTYTDPRYRPALTSPMTHPSPSDALRKTAQKTQPSEAVRTADKVEEPEGSSFNYRPIHTADEIRTLTIQPASRHEAAIICTLQHVTLGSLPKYEALSYTWGDKANQHSILLDGQQFRVRENAAAALRRLRLRSKSRTIWIDAICINQRDPAEKQQQLPLMTKIYEQAEQVCVWLGEATEGSVIGMSELTDKINLQNTMALHTWKVDRKHGGLLLPLRERFRSGVATQESGDRATEMTLGELRELLSRPWWTRVWIMQEAIVAQKLTFMCGEHTASWESVGKKYKKQTKTSRSVSPFGIWTDPAGELFDDIYGVIDGFRTGWATKKYDISLYRLLSEFRRLQCTDPRDRVFAFLGLVSFTSKWSFKPDYTSSVGTTFRNFVRSMIQYTESLDILNCLRESRQQHLRRKRRPAVAYSLVDQARYHDINATVVDGKKTRMAWVRLPPGWERVQDSKTSCHYYDWNTRTRHDISPLANQGPFPPSHVGQQKICPEGWTKTWDNLGRSRVAYDPDSKDPKSNPDPVPADLNDLPSWVPNWAAISDLDAAPLLDWTGDSTPRYSAGGTQPPLIRPDPNPNVLAIDGLEFDKIVQICSPWHPESKTPPMSRKGIDVLHTWEALGLADITTCPYGGTAAARKEALWRTHIGDHAGGAGAEPVSYGRLVECWYDRIGWAREVPRLDDLAGKGLVDTVKLQVLAAHKSEIAMRDHYLALFEGEWTGTDGPSEAQIDESSAPGFQKRVRRELKDGLAGYGACARRIYEMCANRAFFVTGRGYMGLAPWSAACGDGVFVLRGGRTPFILREQAAGGHGLVGEAYVYGIMGGEAWGWEFGSVETVRLV